MKSNRNLISNVWLGILLLATLSPTAMAAARANGNPQPNLRERISAESSARVVRVAFNITESRKADFVAWPFNKAGRWWPIWAANVANKDDAFLNRLDYREVPKEQFANLTRDQRFLKIDRSRLYLNGTRLGNESRARQREFLFNDRDDQLYGTRIRGEASRANKAIRFIRVNESVDRFALRSTTRLGRSSVRNGRDSAERLVHNRTLRDTRPAEAVV